MAIILTNITLSFSESKFAIDCFVVALIIIVITAIIVIWQIIVTASRVNISDMLKG